MKIHHICLVVQDIIQSCEHYKKIFGLKESSKLIIDPTQKVKIVFLKNPNENIEYELVEPLDKSSPVYRTATKKNSLNHICYEVESIEDAIKQFQDDGNILISGPVYAVAFDNRKIVFFYTREHMIVELLESEKREF